MRAIDAALGASPLPGAVRRLLLPYPRYWQQESWVARQFSAFITTLDAGDAFLAFLGFEKPHHPYQLSFETVCENADYLQDNTIELGDPDGKLLQASCIIPHDALEKLGPSPSNTWPSSIA